MRKKAKVAILAILNRRRRRISTLRAFIQEQSVEILKLDKLQTVAFRSFVAADILWEYWLV